MSKEDPAFKIYKDFKYKIGKNPKGNLYLYSNDISYLDRDPLFKQLKYIKKSDTILTTDNEKLVTISSQCIKKCNSSQVRNITTKRCNKKCKSHQKRNKTFKCRSLVNK